MEVIEGRFEGRTIVVTGAGSGIGRATAARIAAEGGRVIAVDISGERLEALAADLGPAVECVTGDLCDDAVIEDVMAAAGDTPKGIRCNAVAPGPVATNIVAHFRADWAGQRLGPFFQTNLPPVAQPEQLAAAITWLLSDDASNASGAILSVDGGWAAV